MNFSIIRKITIVSMLSLFIGNVAIKSSEKESMSSTIQDITESTELDSSSSSMGYTVESSEIKSIDESIVREDTAENIENSDIHSELLDSNEIEVTKVVVQPRGDVNKDQVKERRHMLHSDLELTGIFLEKGKSLDIFVDKEPEDLSIWIGQYGVYETLGLDSETEGISSMETYTLKKGSNTITRENSSGMVYLVNKSDSQIIDVDITGGNKVPHLKLTSTPEEEEAFYKSINAEPNYPFFELEGKYVFGTFQNSESKYLKGLNISDIKKRIEYWDFCFEKTVEFYGFDNNAGGAATKNMTQRIHITNPDTGIGFASATNRRITFQIDTGASEDVLAIPLDESQWGLWHEIGHTFQTPQYLFPDMTEVTVNFSALYIQESLNMTPRIDASSTRNDLKSFLSKNLSERDFYDLGLFERLAVFWTLHRVFGSDYYKAVSQMYRSIPISQLPSKGSEESLQVMIRLFSEVAHRNLVPFFEQWGLSISDETKSICDTYPKLEKDIWLDISGEDERYELLEVLPIYTIPTMNDTETLKLPIFTSKEEVKINSLFSYPLKSDTFVDDIHYEMIGKFSQFGNNVIRLGNANNVYNLMPIDEVTGGNSVVFYGNYSWNDRFRLLGLDHYNKKIRVVGKGENLHFTWGETTYFSVKHYDEKLENVKNEVSINGSGEGSNSQKLQDIFDNKDFEINDIIRIQHEESHNRFNRFTSSNLSTLDDKKIYFYKITMSGWEEIDLAPKVVAKSGVFELGFSIDPKQLIEEIPALYDAPISKIEYTKEPDYSTAGNTTANVKVTNSLGLSTEISINDITITGGNAVKIFGMSSSPYQIIVPDPHTKKFSMKGKSGHLHSNFSDELYVSITHYDKNLKTLNNINLNGNEDSQKLADTFNGLSYNIGDLIRIEHVESHIRLDRYQDSILLEKDRTMKYWYKMTDKGWEQADLTPKVQTKAGKFNLGIEIKPSSLIVVEDTEYDIAIKKIEFDKQPDYSKIGSTGATIKVTNELDMTTIVTVDNIEIIGGNAIKVFGMSNSPYQIIVPNPETKKFSMVGKSGHLHSNFPDELYVSITQYDEKLNVLNNVEITGTEDSQKLADTFNGLSYNIGDLICIEHVESHIRIDRYLDSVLLEKDRDRKYWYRMTEQGWQEEDLNPKAQAKSGKFNLGIKIDPSALIVLEDTKYKVPVKKIEFEKQPDYSKTGSTEATIKVTNELDMTTIVTVDNIEIVGGNAIKVFGMSNAPYQIIVPNPETKTFSMVGKSGYLHSYFPDELYVSITQYDKKLNILNEVELSGTEDSQKLADVFDGLKYSVGDWVCVQHVESHTRIDRYLNDILLEKDRDKKYWYKMVNSGWTFVNEEPVIEDEDSIEISFISDINFGLVTQSKEEHKAILDEKNELPHLNIKNYVSGDSDNWILTVSQPKEFSDSYGKVLKGAAIYLKNIYIDGVLESDNTITVSSIPTQVISNSFLKEASKIVFGNAVQENGSFKSDGVLFGIPFQTIQSDIAYTAQLVWELIADPTT